jgi:N-acetylglucosamine kinase-like BadF-type ATPase
LHQLITTAFAAANQPLTPLKAACLGLTGGWEQAPAMIRELVAVEQLISVQDTVTAHAGALAGQAGIIVISGTGSVAYGQTESGEKATAGGWGYLMGDEGSGYDIGRQALGAAAQALDGRGPATFLVERIPAHFGLTNLTAVHAALYSGQLLRAQIAGLAAVVAQAAGQGDSVALHLFEQAGDALAQAVSAVARRLAWPNPPVSGVGGVFKAGEIIRRPFQQHLHDRLPQAQFYPARYPPVMGAVLLAWQAGGYPPRPEMLQQLEAYALSEDTHNLEIQDS